MSNSPTDVATTRLEPEAYLRHLETESARFREVLEALPGDAAVPTCPDWDADDLLWHLAEVQWFWSEVVRRRPHDVEDLPPPERPTSRTDLLTFFDRSSAALQDQLAQATPEEESWTWSQDRTVGFVQRRQAHEALIHRVDAELTAGSTSALDPRLAADGVDEALTVMYGGCPPWGTQSPTELHVRVDCTDTDTQTWVNLVRFSGKDPDQGTVADQDDLRVVADPGTEPDAVVQGTAEQVDRWLWHRAADDALHVAGDPVALDRLRQVLAEPIT